MFTSDRRMLELKDILKSKGVIRFDNDFCEAIGMLKQNLYQIQNPEKSKRIQHFTPQHIEMAGKVFGANMNFIFGFSHEPFTAKKTSVRTSTSKKQKEQKTEN